MRLTIFDYGAGNMHSLAKALSRDGVLVVIETDPLRSLETDVLVLPGVGGFGQAAERMRPALFAMRDAIVGGLPTVGICLGMQLLMDASEEAPGAGLGVVPGVVSRLKATRVPHLGWNTVSPARPSALDACRVGGVYYAHSYVCRPDDEACVTAWSTHEGDRFPASIRVGQAIGLQFHPEKSSRDGVCLLTACVEEVAS